MAAEALEHLVKGIVEHPDDVVVTERRNRRRGDTLAVRVNPADMGRVIGRSGKTATALRTVVKAVSGSRSIRIDFLDVSER
ncbi:MAG: RNA-binding protein [Actinobacteria bacterium]|nr:RNA-binding protein [Actinomycetota bacterium]MCB9412876.1 RNA-binding protein [Actinomycetota bacterium]